MRLESDISPEALPAVAQLLRKYRRQIGKGLKEVAHDAEISVSHLSKLENGKRVALSKRALGGLASALDIPPPELFAAAAVLPRQVEQQMATPDLAYAIMDGYRLPTATRGAMRRIHLAALASRAQPVMSSRDRVEPDKLLEAEGFSWRADSDLAPPDVRITPGQVVCAGDPEDAGQASLIRFELAHAYAHIRLGTEGACSISSAGDRAEQDATAFAAFILAPVPILLAAAQSSRLEVWEDGPGAFIREVAGRLAAPGWLVARRLSEEGLLAQAAGLSES